MFFDSHVVEQELQKAEALVHEGLADYSQLAGFRLTLMRISKLVHGDTMTVVLKYSFGVQFAQSLARIMRYFGLTCTQLKDEENSLVIIPSKGA